MGSLQYVVKCWDWMTGSGAMHFSFSLLLERQFLPSCGAVNTKTILFQMSLCKSLLRVVPPCTSSLRALHTTTRCLQRSTTLLERPPLSVFQPLQDIAPTFYACGNNITPLYEPSDFYSELKVRYDSILW